MTSVGVVEVGRNVYESGCVTPQCEDYSENAQYQSLLAPMYDDGNFGGGEENIDYLEGPKLTSISNNSNGQLES